VPRDLLATREKPSCRVAAADNPGVWARTAPVNAGAVTVAARGPSALNLVHGPGRSAGWAGSPDMQGFGQRGDRIWPAPAPRFGPL
jgi:hypothetical protein